MMYDFVFQIVLSELFLIFEKAMTIVANKSESSYLPILKQSLQECIKTRVFIHLGLSGMTQIWDCDL